MSDDEQRNDEGEAVIKATHTGIDLITNTVDELMGDTRIIDKAMTSGALGAANTGTQAIETYGQEIQNGSTPAEAARAAGAETVVNEAASAAGGTLGGMAAMALGVTNPFAAVAFTTGGALAGEAAVTLSGITEEAMEIA